MGCFGGPYLIQTLMAAACQAKQQKNPGAVVACIKQLDWMTGLGFTHYLDNEPQAVRGSITNYACKVLNMYLWEL